MKMLERWEAEAEEILECKSMADVHVEARRILTLIDLVRQKDALISEMKAQTERYKGPVASDYVEMTCDVLLALTEKALSPLQKTDHLANSKE